MSSMVRNYSFFNLQPNQESTSLPNHQEPTTTLQELSTHQELTIILQKPPPMTIHHYQESLITFQELPLLPTPIQIPKIILKDQPLLSITLNTFKTTSNTDLDEKIAMFEGFECLPSHGYYALGITLKKKVAVVNVRLYRHSYLQQDELKKGDKEMITVGLIPHHNGIFRNDSSLSFNLEDKAYLKKRDLIRGKLVSLFVRY